jgi:hypothetical protein
MFSYKQLYRKELTHLYILIYRQKILCKEVYNNIICEITRLCNVEVVERLLLKISGGMSKGKFSLSMCK